MSTDITTFSMTDSNEGMVSIMPKPSSQPPQPQPPPPQPPAFSTQEKNMSENKETMDSTPIYDLMNPPAMGNEAAAAMAPQVPAANPQAAFMPAPMTQTQAAPESKNPLNLTDDQMIALVAGAATALAVSKPVQDKLVTTIPRFLNEQGSRSVVGLASTGLVAAVVFYFVKDYVVKP